MSSARHCPNPDCPFRVKYQKAADYRPEATTCSDCGSALADGPAPAAVPEVAVGGAVALPLPGVGEGGGVDLWRRAGVSLAALAAAAFSSTVMLPGVDPSSLEALRMGPSGGERLSMLSVFGLALNPFISAFVVVELAALLVPRWRPLRTGGPESRARLRTATVVVGVLFALVQSLGIARFLEDMQAGAYPFFRPSEMLPMPVLMGVLTGAAVALHLLTVLVDRQGLGNGYAVVMLGLSVPPAYGMLSTLLELVSAGVVGAVPVLVALLGVMGLVRVVVRLLRGRVPVVGKGVMQPVAFQLPTAGLAPLTMTAALLSLTVSLANLGVLPRDIPRALESGPLVNMLVFFVLSALLTVGLSVLFHQPGRVGATWAALTAKDEASRAQVLASATLRARAVLPEATKWSLLFVLLGWLPSRLGTNLLGLRLADAAPLLFGVAIVVDLLDEVRMREQGTWVAVWPVHRVYEVEPALAALSAAGIPARARGTYARALMQFFGPYFAIDLMVPPERAEEARALLAAAQR